ncbi:MAG: hypothetical protein JWM86_1863 [Thermoleophilia bacterium]|nr:hypothetical protein [Thermoleophilia bacterium]
MPNPMGSGLERAALDLHLHTPASHDWKGGVITAQQFVETALDRGLDGIAITDHQTPGWVDAVKQAAVGTGLTVFPGVEIDNLAGSKGIHIIALFDVGATADEIDTMLAAIGAIKYDGNHQKVRQPATEGPLKVLNCIQEAGGIAVLAHSQSSKGVLGDMQGALRREIVRHPAVLAVEAKAEDFYDDDKRKNHRRTFDLLDGTDATYNRKLAVYQSSDNPAPAGTGHSLDGIGTRFSYFHVEKPMTLESLRQCFVDREMRIEMPLPGASAVTADAVAFPHIKHVKVSGGFLGDLELALHHGLTTVLGAKGSAKSLFVELLRFALNQEPEQTDIRRDHDSKLVERLGVYESVSVTFVDASGHEHMVERKLDPVSGNPYTSQAADPAVHFPCHFLSQGEVVRIAESPDEQLTFIDSFFDFRSRQARIDGLRDSLGQLDAQVAAHIAARKQLKVLQVQEKSLDAEIGEKDKQLKSPIFERFRSAQAKNQAVQQVIDAADRHRLYLQDVWEATKAMSVPVSALAEDPVIARVTQVLSKQLVSSEGFVRQAVAAAEQAAAEIEAERDKWRPQFEKVSLEHAEELRKVGGSSAALRSDFRKSGCR